jgi:hypothetical protein
MATPSEKLAESLSALRELQQREIVAIHTSAISRTHRARLVENGFLKEVYQGWYIAISPNEIKGDSTSWYSSFWTFCAQYLEDKYKTNWCISPEQSLILHAGNWTIPTQLIIKSPDANNYNTVLPYGTSLFHMRSPLPVDNEITLMQGLRILTLPAALVNVSQNTFVRNATDVRTALTMVKDASDISRILLDGGKSVVAGRLAGAFRNVNQNRIADDILKTMQAAGYEVRESDPFEDTAPVKLSNKEQSPYGNRIRLMWYKWREVVVQNMPSTPGLPSDKQKYMKAVEDVFVTDAYHSLSIEKYTVTPELIERVRSGKWNEKENEADRKQKDAMAAKGYWDAFQLVEKSVLKVLNGENAGRIADQDHGDWYRGLFAPSVASGIIKASDLAGYRTHQVYIGQSMHVPLNKEAVRDAMPVLFELLEQENEASVRAVLGHFIFVFIHPYMDGNGRMGRFLMNVMLASGGYPWTVIPVESRTTYMHALEQASVNQNIEPFAKFIGYLVGESLKNKPVAKI